MVMLYDTVVLQDGRYQCTVQKSGTMDAFVPSSALGKIDRSSISFAQPGKEAMLLVSDSPLALGKPLLRGVPDAFFDADFFPLLEESGLRGHSSIQLQRGDWSPEIKRIARTSLTMHRQGLLESQSIGSGLQKSKWAEVFVLDSIGAGALKLPVAMDPRAGPLIDNIRRMDRERLRQEVPDVFMKEWITFGLPDFEKDTWESLIALRDLAVGVDFRRMVSEIESQVLKESGNLQTADDLSNLVQKYYIQEVIAELNSRRTSATQATVSLALNFTSVSLFGNVKEYWQAFKEQRTWVNVLNPKA